jgi:membrane-bound lytic murein transglycosylase D
MNNKLFAKFRNVCLKNLFGGLPAGQKCRARTSFLPPAPLKYFSRHTFLNGVSFLLTLPIFLLSDCGNLALVKNRKLCAPAKRGFFKHTFLNREFFKKVLLISLLMLCGNLIIAEAQEGGRPLRVGRPVGQIIEQTAASYQNPVFNSSSLILSHQALEQALTQYYIGLYSRPAGIASLNAALERGSIYLPFIREEIRRRNLPPELAYLPVVESGFVITARSRSGAAGLWQFMMNSISPFDMRVTELIDERRDFIKSTRGALQKLQDNYRALGDWHLALAAYNCGLGEVTRTVRRTGVRDFWELSARNQFRQETLHYVPKLAAAAFILSQPRRFGVNIWQDQFEWTSIPLRRQVSLDILAQEAGIDRELLRNLNAELLHGISPAGGYSLKIPLAQLESVTEVLEREDIRLIRYHYHVVRHGDTLWSMSRHYGASLNVIEQHNPGITNRYLRIGETVIIPAYADVAPAPAPTPARPLETAVFNGSHVVARGETFWSLGRRYGVDPQALAEANGMSIDQILHEGRTIKVPIIE